jgi:hypothetical protein
MGIGDVAFGRYMIGERGGVKNGAGEPGKDMGGGEGMGDENGYGSSTSGSTSGWMRRTGRSREIDLL